MNINENVKKMIKIRQKMIKLMCITNPGTGSRDKKGHVVVTNDNRRLFFNE